MGGKNSRRDKEAQTKKHHTFYFLYLHLPRDAGSLEVLKVTLKLHPFLTIIVKKKNDDHSKTVEGDIQLH